MVGCFSFSWRGYEGSLFSFSPCIRTFRLRLLSSGSTSAVCSILWIGVDFMAPSIRRNPMFWTLSNLLLLVFDAVPHVVEAYSIVGLTAPVYVCLRILESAPHFVPASFFRRASLRMPFLSIPSICGFQVSLLSKVTPRKVGV